ncbi:unnamed protein product [Pleuronectes platessa]|uniref:Uncharacterized protein n=1 Tax=Pleuronectes platessa TaxID=8262 RepID=A0A9N7VB51_PLEPL|nr:unnamed protein product [Pleuronectes platessa]
MEQPTWGLTYDPALERDWGLSSNTILPAYSPQWLPAATHNEALCWGLSGQKGPLLQLNHTVVRAKRFCLAAEPGRKMKQSLESRAFLPMARSLGGQLDWVYAIHKYMSACGRFTASEPGAR